MGTYYFPQGIKNDEMTILEGGTYISIEASWEMLKPFVKTIINMVSLKESEYSIVAVDLNTFDDNAEDLEPYIIAGNKDLHIPDCKGSILLGSGLSQIGFVIFSTNEKKLKLVDKMLRRVKGDFL